MISNLRRSLLPPWLWLWLLFSLFLTATNIDIQRSFIDLFTGSIVANAVATEGLTRFPWLFRIMDLTDLWPPLLFLLGVATAFAPQLRAKLVEKQYRLTEDLKDVPQDLIDFIHQVAPELQIKTNLSRFASPFVYPSGYRQAVVAIFLSTIENWSNEEKRPATQIILLHEIAHYRHGDVLVVGEGSFLDSVLNHWMLVFCVVGLFPEIIIWVEHSIDSVQSSIKLGAPLPLLLQYELVMTLTLFIPQGGLLIIVEELLQTISLITLPIVAFWCLEFNADQAALSEGHTTKELIDALSQTHSSGEGALFALTAHPPKCLRSWMARNMAALLNMSLLLILFPFFALSLLLGVVPTFILQYSEEMIFPKGTDLVHLFAVDVVSVLVNIAPMLGVTALILLVWPLISASWERLFVHSGNRAAVGVQDITWSQYNPYFFCACLTALLALCCCVLYVFVK